MDRILKNKLIMCWFMLIFFSILIAVGGYLIVVSDLPAVLRLALLGVELVFGCEVIALFAEKHLE